MFLLCRDVGRLPDLRYAALNKADIPKTECLKDTIATRSRSQTGTFSVHIVCCPQPQHLNLVPISKFSCKSVSHAEARVMPFWESAIAPELKKGKTIFVAAHGNSIRAILKFLEGISDDDITGRWVLQSIRATQGQTLHKTVPTEHEL